MGCVTNISQSELSDMFKAKNFDKFKENKPQTIEELSDWINYINDLLEVKEVPEAEIKDKKIPTQGGKGRVYQFTKEPLYIEKTSTTEPKQNFIKTVGKKQAEEINTRRDSIIKRETGTIFHEVMEDLNALLTQDPKYKDRFILRNKSKRIPTRNEILSKIPSDTSVKAAIYKVLEDTARAEFDAILVKQNAIDPKGKILVDTESKSFAVFKSGKHIELIAGTQDLTFYTSDLKAHLRDYKFIVPPKSVMDNNEIIDPLWIPDYHYGDWELQLGKSIEMIKQTTGAKGLASSRVIPIQMNFVKDINTQEITNKVFKVASFATQKVGQSALDPIPILENLDDPKLAGIITKLRRVLNNRKIELSKTPYETFPQKHTEIRKSIENVQKAINMIIVNRDMSALYQHYNKHIIGKYVQLGSEGEFNSLKVTDVDLRKLLDLLNEVSVVKDLVQSSEDFFEAIKIKDPSIIAKYKVVRDRLSVNLSTMEEALKEEIILRMSNITDENLREAIQGFDPTDLKYLTRQFRTLSEINHPAFQVLNRYITTRGNKTRLELQEYADELAYQLGELDKASGSKGLGIFKDFINPETGNLYSPYNKDFLANRSKAKEVSDKKWMLTYYKLKDNAAELLDEYFKAWKAGRDIDESTVEGKREAERWKKTHSLETALFSNSLLKYYELKPEYSPSSKQAKEVYSTEYLAIYNDPAKRAFYEFWGESMRKFRKLLGITNEYEKLPDNAIPWFRKDMLESILSGNATHNVGELVKAAFHYTTDDFESGTDTNQKVDVETGAVLHEVPRALLRPLINSEGEIDKSLKSMNLGKVLYAMAEMSFWYNNMMDIEAEVNSIALMVDLLSPVDKTGKKGISEMFNAQVKATMYGVTLQTDDPQLAKRLTTANRIGIASVMAGKFMLQLGALASSKANQGFEGKKGIAFNTKQWALGEKDLLESFKTDEKGKLISTLIYVFEPHNPTLDVRALSLTKGWIVKQGNKNIPFIVFRKSSEFVNQVTFLAMLRSHGIAENGRIVNLKYLPDGSKSLLELSSIKDGKLHIEGMMTPEGGFNVDMFTMFRNKVVATAKSIHGEMSPNDINLINTTLLGKLLMTYKNWLPTMTAERFAGMRIDNPRDVVTIGRFNAVYQENIKRIWDSNASDSHKKWWSLLTLIGSLISKAALTLIPFGSHIINNKYTLRVSSLRAEELFNQFKLSQPEGTTINGKPLDELSKKEFMDYYEGQINAAIAELKTVLVFVALVLFAAGDWDDDGEKDWKKSWATRRAYRLANRIRRELGFFYGSEGLLILSQNQLPIASHLVNSVKLLDKIWHESMDIVLDREDPSNEKATWRYITPFIPYNQFVPTFIDIDKVDEQREF